MATTGSQVNTTPTELIAGLSLTRGSKYFVQNGGAVDVYFAEAASAPAVTSPNVIVLSPRQNLVYQPPSGTEGLYAWVRSGGPVEVGYVVFNPWT